MERPSSAVERQFHRKRSSLSGLTCDIYTPVVPRDDLLARGQTQSGAANLGGEKRVEDLVKVLASDASIVAIGDDSFPGCPEIGPLRRLISM